jgi:hypothetical protein
MDQNTGRFVSPEPKKQALLDQLDSLEKAGAPVVFGRPPLPELGPDEIADAVVVSGPESSSCVFSIVVEKIKASGKLFVRGPLDSLGIVGVNDVVSIKGVKFLVRRVNDRGQIGLRMLTTAEIAELEARAAAHVASPGLPAPDWKAEQAGREALEPTRVMGDFAPEKLATRSPSQIARAERRERRIEELELRRKRNRTLSENGSRALFSSRSENGVVTTQTGKEVSKEFGARCAAERAERKRLRPILRAQEKQRQKAEAEEQSRARQEFRRLSPEKQDEHTLNSILGAR